ncbi:MAG: hypothetical protein V3T81_07765, partial [Thermoanaerobaculia bacterium]
RGTRRVYGDEAEPCHASWTDRLGFTVIAEVAHEDRLGFAMLQRDGVAANSVTGYSLAGCKPAEPSAAK